LVDIDDSLTWEGEMPQLDRRNRSWWRVLDERSDAGGRAKAWLFLTHPGPSLLVTAVVVAAAGLLTRQLPSARTATGLVLVMLPIQLGIGALNDWADVRSDASFKPYKPIPRGLVRRDSALALALAGFAVSIAAAAWLGAGVVGAAALGVAAGASYDLGLKRTPVAVVAWWAGFVTVPLMAMVATGRLYGVAATIPLAGLLSLALLIANGLPDSEADRRGGANTLPVVLGPGRSRCLIAVALGAAALFVVAARAGAGQDRLALVAAGLLSAAALVPLLPRGAPRLAFPLIALLAAGAAVSWLAALPLPAPA
jgi:geranylgeranylglycerol-phosphate geranylgeranyltransferase